MFDYTPMEVLSLLSRFFSKRTADILAPRLSVVFQHLLCLVVLQLAGDRPMSTPIPKDLPSSMVTNFHNTFTIKGV